MASNAISEGKVLRWKNTTGSLVKSGEVVPLKDKIGVALVDIPDDSFGSIAVAEVFDLPKGNDTFIMGQNVYWNKDSSCIVSTSSGNLNAGYCVENEVAADAGTIQVKLNGSS